MTTPGTGRILTVVGGGCGYAFGRREAEVVQHGVTLVFMPTTRPRHTITETPTVQAALEELRAKLGEAERIDFAELVTLGAQVKTRRLADRSEEARRARREMIDWILNGNGPKVDLEAAEEVKRLGLIARYDDE
jgi:hypothetical protein